MSVALAPPSPGASSSRGTLLGSVSLSVGPGASATEAAEQDLGLRDALLAAQVQRDEEERLLYFARLRVSSLQRQVQEAGLALAGYQADFARVRARAARLEEGAAQLREVSSTHTSDRAKASEEEASLAASLKALRSRNEGLELQEAALLEECRAAQSGAGSEMERLQARALPGRLAEAKAREACIALRCADLRRRNALLRENISLMQALKQAQLNLQRAGATAEAAEAGAKGRHHELLSAEVAALEGVRGQARTAKAAIGAAMAAAPEPGADRQLEVVEQALLPLLRGLAGPPLPREYLAPAAALRDELAGVLGGLRSLRS